MSKSNNISSTVLVLILISIAASFLFTGCKNNEIRSHWVQQSIFIDGKMDDWNGLPTNHFEDHNANLSICNDSTHLYLQFRTKDIESVRAIKMSGLTIFLDTQGSRKKDFYLKFIGGPSNNELKKLHGQKKTPTSENIPAQMKSRFAKMMEDRKPELICFDKKRYLNKPILLDGTEGPAAAFGKEHSFYIYEFKIPFQKSSTSAYGINTEVGTKISIGAVWGDMEEFKNSMRPPQGERPGGGMSGGKGGRSGGGTGGGRGGGKGSQGGEMKRPDLPEKQEVWLKTVLVSKTE